MIKEIGNSNTSVRPFKVYKQWHLSGSAASPSGSAPISDLEQDEVFWVVSSNTNVAGKYDPVIHRKYDYPLWNSIKKLYYTNQINEEGITFMGVDQLGDRRLRFSSLERRLQNGDDIIVITIPPDQYGEGMKRETININIETSATGSFNIFDDGFSNLYRDDQVHIIFTELDFENETFTFTDAGFNGIYVGDIDDLDLNENEITLTYNNETKIFELLSIEVEGGVEGDISYGFISVNEEAPATLGGIELAPAPIGNVFYEQGLMVLNKSISTSILVNGSTLDGLQNFIVSFKSTVTIYEHEFILNAAEGEFNVSQNPTAVKLRDGVPLIENEFIGSNLEYNDVDNAWRVVSGFASGSIWKPGDFNDYFTSGSTDPTGSYLTPFATTIGLYDDDLNMLAVAKLAQPIKMLPDEPINFIVKLDT